MPQKNWSNVSFTKRHIVIQRKRKAFLSQLIQFAGVFIVSLSILLGFSLWKNKRHGSFINPLTTGRIILPVTDTAETENQLKKLLENASIQITTMERTSDSALIIKNVNGETYTFSSNKDLTQQASSLQRIKTQLTIEDKRLKTVDFRFDDPVITLF